MENHRSRWFDVQSVPKSHIFSHEDRPGKEPVPVCRTIPIVDLGLQRLEMVRKIIEASREFGLFQVINHGMEESVIVEAIRVFKELFSMPAEEILKEANESGWVYMGSTSHGTKGGANLWRDNIKHPCHPLEECMKHWPRNPTRYREVIERYIVEIRRLSLRVLELISEGLGLEEGYLGGISQVQILTASNYPPCPDPSLTLGVLKHVDHSLITILAQGNARGLQVFKDGKWLGVEVVPNAFVVNIGSQLEIISNGKLRGAEHRVVTNQEVARTTIATFINPVPDCIIQPAEVLLTNSNPALYPPLSFREFVNANKAFGPHTDALQNGVISKISS
ncbi:Iron/ascorbate family oxidoreductase [Handroanthus impetiginosus]|uniref:Iron/ascorbate family oxidoreductase n=1 Tax=Handroanthus impetiginosus TaxID=429701 RepID=A0A2G9GG96_9LAMI|nr:Iron/ascorbate family oxidoreductase [Handroanthus impetiginosus]